MPLPIKKHTPEQLESARTNSNSIINKAIELGAMELCDTFRLAGLGSEMLVIGPDNKVFVNRRSIPVEVVLTDWVADCKSRGVVPVVPNRS